MQGTIKRTPRACERCRQTRRRCLPPYPCRQCVAADVPCEVRDKARPQRRQPLRKTPSIQARDNIVPNVADGLQHHSRTPSGLQSKCSTPCVEQALPRDTFALLKGLVQDILLQQHGYVMTCALSEPPSLSKPPLSAVELIDQHIQRPLQSERLWELLMGFQRLIGWQDAKLLDVQELHVTACTYAEHLLDLSPNGVRASAITEQFPLDSVALMFVALALGAIATGELSHGQTLFEISTEVVKHFAGSPSMQLCLAYYLQHMFALRIGTSNYQQGIIAQTVQTAHDLGLHRNTYGVQGLKLFLIVYMADQYCSWTYDTEPIIRTSNLKDQIFEPLKTAEPQLQTLISLVTMNGYVIEHSHKPQDIAEVEAKIGDLCSRQTQPVPVHLSCGGFRTSYEPHARVHMLCCRLRLRAPGLSNKATWLPSLSICLHAAGGVLSTYLLLYQPVLVTLARQSNKDTHSTDKTLTPIAHKLAATWRQVRRIMMSVFVIAFAYWHGELIHTEAARYMAIARLLLEYPRWKWGEKLNEAIQTLIDISHFSDFILKDHMRALLPEVNERFPRPLHHDHAAPDAVTAYDHAVDQTASYDEAAMRLWPETFEGFGVDGHDISAFEQQTLFGAWDIEFALDGGA